MFCDFGVLVDDLGGVKGGETEESLSEPSAEFLRSFKLIFLGAGDGDSFRDALFFGLCL